MQGGIDILRHPASIPADIKVSTGFEPVPQVCCRLEHAMLNVSLLGLIAREGEVQSVQIAARLPLLERLLIKEVGRASLITKEEPVLSGCAGDEPLFEERAEGRDPSA